MFEPNTSANKNRKLNKISKILEFINWITQLNSVEMGQLKIKDGKKKQNMMYHSTVFPLIKMDQRWKTIL
jgi:hypothetical protein